MSPKIFSLIVAAGRRANPAIAPAGSVRIPQRQLLWNLFGILAQPPASTPVDNLIATTLGFAKAVPLLNR